jgi:predicted nicotinamide N-methyase
MFDDVTSTIHQSLHRGVVLSRWLSRHPELVVGREVLEVGAGLGAPGLTAAACGASRVALTDVDSNAVRNLAYNARRGGGVGLPSHPPQLQALIY